MPVNTIGVKMRLPLSAHLYSFAQGSFLLAWNYVKGKSSALNFKYSHVSISLCSPAKWHGWT